MASTDARPLPIKNTAYRAVFPILDADGDLQTGAASLDSEVSKDQGAFTDCSNEATEIGSSGMYYLDLTSTEMNADCVTIIVKTGTAGAKTTPLVLYPQESGDIKVEVQTYPGNTVQTGDNFARLGAPAGASHAADLLVIDNLVDDLETRLTAVRAGYLDNLSAGAAALESSLQTLITTIGVAGAGIATVITAAVWNAVASTYNAALSMGNKLNAAGSAGDPWSASLGLYGAGTAGKLLSDNLNATVSSRASQTSVDDVPTNAELTAALGTADDVVLTQVALVKAKTDLIPAAPAAVGDIPTALQVVDALLARDLGSGTGAGVLNERTVRSALRFNRNKFTIAGGVLTVYREDDVTVAFTAAITQTAGDPVSASDPV